VKALEKEKVIAIMNEALKMELASSLKYLDFSFRVFGPTRKPIVEHFLEEAKESFDHATMLGDKIVALGGTPSVVAEVPKVPAKASLNDLLRLGLENEGAAIDIYSKILGMVQDETHLRVLFENQVLAEREHFEELSKMLRR
jgi:bacterioferritin